MGRSVPGILSFTAGELSPLLDGRVDIDKYFAGTKRCENFITSVQGPAVRRPGTRFVANTKNNGNAWLARFVFNRVQSYILEFGENYIRFFTNRGVLLNGLSPLEVSSPWSYADLTTTEGTFALQFAQVGDILYMTHSSGLFRPMKLSRLGATNWTLTDIVFDRGPFKDIDAANTITITPSALTGAGITLTASAPLFNPLHVGTQFYVEKTDLGGYPAWEVGKAIALNDKRRYNGNVYQATVAKTTGTLPPTHLRGTFNDGNDGVPWQYIHSGYGMVLITGFTSSTVVTATVLTGEGLGVRLPGNAANAEAAEAFTRWAFQEISDIEGWPVAIEFANERLCLAKSRTIYMSEAGIYESWAERTGFEVTALNAIRYPVNLKNIDAIRWMSNNKELLVGTDSFEFSIEAQTAQQVFGPANIRAKPQTEVGSRTLQPLSIENATVHIQDAGLRLRQLLYSYEIERYQSDDLSVLAEHIPSDGGGIVDYCKQRETDPVIWSVMANGNLAGTTYNRIRGVVGWHRHPLGGYSNSARTVGAKVKSCESIAAPARNRDDVWLIVERFINNATARFIEYIEDPALLKTGQSFCFYVDAGLSYDGINQVPGNLTYNFELNSNLGWTAGYTMTPSFTGLNLTAPVADPSFSSPAISILGNSNRFVELDIERTAVRTVGTWEGQLFWANGGGIVFTSAKTLPEMPNTIGARQTYLLDMATIEVGPNTWINQVITQLRFDFEAGSPNGTFKLHSLRTRPTGGAVASISGFDHLKGETVQVFGNGGPMGDEVITAGGVLNADVPITFGCAGLGYRSALTPMRMEPPVDDGTAQSRLKSTGELVVRLLDTIGGSHGLTVDNVDPIPSRPHNLPVGMPTPIFSGDRYVVSPSDINRDGFITIVQDQPCPMTLISIYPRLDVHD